MARLRCLPRLSRLHGLELQQRGRLGRLGRRRRRRRAAARVGVAVGGRPQAGAPGAERHARNAAAAAAVDPIGGWVAAPSDPLWFPMATVPVPVTGTVTVTRTHPQLMVLRLE